MVKDLNYTSNKTDQNHTTMNFTSIKDFSKNEKRIRFCVRIALISELQSNGIELFRIALL